MRFIIPCLMLALGIVTYFFRSESPEIVDDSDDETKVLPSPKNPQRSVAGKFGKTTSSDDSYRPAVTTSRKNQELFKDYKEEPDAGGGDSGPSAGAAGTENKGGIGGFFSDSGSASSAAPSYNPPSSSTSRSTAPAKGTSAASSSVSLATGTSGMLFSPPKTSASTGTTPTTTTSVAQPLSCSSNISSGTYSMALNITLTCSSKATIYYCLSTVAYCDPATNGTIYSGPLSIGSVDGPYYLSFYGVTSAVESSQLQALYNIDRTAPDMAVTFNKIQYQTTDLQGMNYFTSTLFGNHNYEAAQINFKSHDPGPTGLNLSCDDMASNLSTITSPSPSYTWNVTDLFTVSNGSQVNIPLVFSDMVYGDNYFGSYVANTNTTPVNYSCAVNKVTLLDFEIFSVNPMSGDAGTNSVREFSGGFTAYGFFEPEATVFRGPAGSSTDTIATESLDAGMFAIIY